MFSEIEINAKVDNGRVFLPLELVKTKKIGKNVYLVQMGTSKYFVIGIYYKIPENVKSFIKVPLKYHSGSRQVTIPDFMRKNSESFRYGNNVMLVDKGEYLEILPWPAP